MTDKNPDGYGPRGILTIIRDIGYVSFGKYGQYVVTVVTLPLTARVLGTEGLGLLAIGMASYFIGSMLIDLGITSFLAAKMNDENVNQLRGDYIAIRATILTTLGAALCVSLLMGADVYVHMIVLGLFTGGVWSLSEDWVLIGQGRFGASTAYQGIGRLVFLALLVLLLPRYPHASIVLLCLLASSIPTVALTWRDSFRVYGRPARPAHVREILRIGAPVLTSRLLITTYGQGAPAIYSGVLSAASLGLFSASDRLVRAVQSLLDPIGFALLPRMARKNNRDDFWRSATRALLATLCAAAVATAIVWLAAPLAINLIFGDGFEGAVALLRVEILVIPATALTSFVTTAVLPVKQDTSGILIGAIIGVSVAGVSLFVASRTHSVWALVYGTLMCEFAVAAWYTVRTCRIYVRERANHETPERSRAETPTTRETTE